MPLAPGARLGPYEILAPLGAGGMGEVYRARDTKLKRDVALKVLPETFARDPERMARFEREAQVLASLNHPNIAHLYGLEGNALVMELVDGETLPCPLPVDTALNYAKQITEALEYAHERGVIHRDLKPANIKVTSEGTVKLLDFGLAKAIEDVPVSDDDPANSPTLTLGATRLGMILGTAAYMSPEQASGKPADRRADIWSFGAVLYEMLAGKKAFAGESASDTLATVLKLDPDWTALPAETPAAIRRLIQRCLTKDRKQRLQAIGEARIVLEHPSEDVAEVRSAGASWLAWGAAAVLFVVAAVLSIVHFREKPPAPAEPVRFQIPPPEKTSFTHHLSLSPDGRKLAFSAATPDGRPALWVHSLDAIDSRLLVGTENYDGGEPFWSADSRYLAFGTDRKLKKIDVTGGPPQSVCDASGIVVGGGWNREGIIIFGVATAGQGLGRISAAGGAVSPLTVMDSSRNEYLHLLPSFLPDGRHFFYTNVNYDPAESGVYLGSLDARPEQQSRKRLVSSPFGAVYAPTPDPAMGRLLFLRDGTLMEQPFDNGRLELTGEASPVAEQVGIFAQFGQFGASSNGTLVYKNGVGSGFELTWYDRKGTVLGVAGPAGNYNALALSPDGARVAVSRIEAQTGGRDIWLIDLARAISTRFTLDATNSYPVWSRDGGRVVFMARGVGGYSLYQQRSMSGVGGEEALVEAKVPVNANDLSTDGRFLLYSVRDPKTKSDLWLLPMNGDRKPEPYLKTQFAEAQGQFSPDGQRVAYRSDQSGRNEIYVQPFPASAGGIGQLQVSSGGGEQPRWRRDGKELFYLANDGTVTAVDITTSPSFQIGNPKPLFNMHSIHAGTADQFIWDVTADGKKFLIITAAHDSAASPVTVVLNWQTGLKK